MKKAIIILFSLLMVLSLVACGSQPTAEESNTNSEQTENTTYEATETEQAEESAEPVETEVTTEPEEETPTFDTSWAGDGYIMPIPEPPFTQFDIKKNEYSSGSVRYMISAFGDEISVLTQDDIMAYKEKLIDAGFTCVDYESDFSEESYIYAAYTDDKLIHVTFECHIQMGAIVIVVDQNSVIENGKDVEISQDDTTTSVIPELPEAEWKKETLNDNTYTMTTDYIEYAEIEKYIEKLSEENFNIIEIEVNEGGYCEFQAEKGVGNTFYKINIQYGSDGTDCKISITEKTYS